MSAATRKGAVVVAIDDAGTAADAVDWASAEAAARRCPLRIVHALRSPLPADPYVLAPSVENFFTARTTAETLLGNAATRAGSVASDIVISTRLLRGTPRHALLEVAHGAQLLVLGSRALRGVLARSVSVHVAAHATCPVVIIHPAQGLSGPGWSPPRVVVGVDASPASTAAVGYAFGAARQRGLPLIAVRAWSPDRPGDPADRSVDPEAIWGTKTLAEFLARRSLDRALARWRPEFGDVAVHATIVRGDPAQVLIAQSHGAALLVIGSRARGHLRGTVSGSVSQALLRDGHSPLAVIHHDPLTAQPPAIAPPEHNPRPNGTGRRDTPRYRRRPGP